MKILPDGSVEIRNKKTGETKTIGPNDLGKYGLDYSTYVEQAKAYQQIPGNKPVVLDEKTAQQKEKDAKSKEAIQGIIDTAGKLKQQGNETGIFDVLLGKLGLSSKPDEFNSTKQMMARYAAKAAESAGGRVSDADVKDFQKNILNTSAIGLSNVEGSKVDNFINNLLALGGYSPEDFNIKKNETKHSVTLNKEGMPVSSNPILETFNKYGQRASQDSLNIASGMAELPKMIGEANAQGGIPKVISELLKGQVQEYANVIQNPVKSIRDRPVSTFLDALPFIGGMKASLPEKVSTISPEVANAAKVVKTAETVKPSLLDKVLGKTGQYLRDDVVKIETEPSIWGAKKEAAIKQTLKDLGVKGSPEQQYSQLAPKMEALASKIEDSSLYKDPKPVSVSTVIGDFEKNLGSEIRRSTLDRGSIKSLAEGYIQDVYGAANDGKVIPETIQTPDLFKLKKLVNEDYQAVAKKLKNNLPLTDRERVIAVARQTLDDVVASKHPDVKKYTVMQSHLYDSVDSIYSARKAPGPRFKLFGSEIPLPKDITQSAQDVVGRALQGGR